MNNKTIEILTTVGLAVIAFAAVSAVTMIIMGPNDSGHRVLAHDGYHADTDDPPWVKEDGTIDMNLVPDRLALADGNGGIFGYVEVDKDPNDDPNPGDPGFDEWNNSDPVYANETGDEVVGHMRWDTPGGDDRGVFEAIPVNEDATGGPIELPE